MATGGSGLGGLVPVAMMVFGIVSILRNRRDRKVGKADDPGDEDRRASAAEVQRRMASYLAGRETGSSHRASLEQDEQENSR